jgi:hypothetical protein
MGLVALVTVHVEVAVVVVLFQKVLVVQQVPWLVRCFGLDIKVFDLSDYDYIFVCLHGSTRLLNIHALSIIA